MYDVTVKGVTGSSVTQTAASKGEMLDRVRYAMESEYTSEVIVSKSIENLLSPVGTLKCSYCGTALVNEDCPNFGNGESHACSRSCPPTHEAMMPDAQHYLDCTVWNFKY